MSVILDALRKSQREHEERGPVLMLVPRPEPDLEPERRLWPWLTTGALAIGAVAFAAGYWSLGLPLPWPDATRVAEAPTKPIETAAPASEPTAATTSVPIVEPAASPTVAAAPQPAATIPPEPIAPDPAPEPVIAPEPAEETPPAAMPAEPTPAPATPAPVQQATITEPVDTAVQTLPPAPPAKPVRLAAAPAAEPPAADQPVAEPEKAVAAPEEIAEPPAEAVVVAALPPDPYENLPMLWSLPSSFQGSVPPLNISVHYYTADARRRMVFVNREKFREGDEVAPGLRLDAITPNGIVLSFRGTQFQVARP